MQTHLVVVGQMASGKTTVGRLLAERLGRPWSDSDRWIEEHLGLGAAELLRRDGLRSLHDAEERHLLEALASPESQVIAVAAGILDRPHLVDRLRKHLVVWLRARPETLLARARMDPDRPMVGDPAGYLHRLSRRPRPVLQGLAHVAIDVDERSPEEIASEAMAVLGEGTITI